MNISISDNWLRDFLKTDASPKEIQEALSLCGASVERLNKIENDFVYEVEVTTNRVDLMSVAGIAKEAVAILPQFKHKSVLVNNPYDTKLSIPTATKVPYLRAVVDSTLALRFSAILIKNITVKPSPDYLVKRLEAAGMRGLNNVVDISNYLMLEMGQPIHTFDYDKILGSKMVLRESRKGEKLTTLDGKTHILAGGDIVIEDGSRRLIDLCGIMGGRNSAVDQNTKNVLLFVQTYEPTHIRKTVMLLAHRTDAATLFEKGLPTEIVLPTMAVALGLFKQLTGGQPANVVLDIMGIRPAEKIIKLKRYLTDFVNERLGITLSQREIYDILKRLEFIPISEQEVKVPFARWADVSIPEDLVEEVARIHGYHNLPTALMDGLLPTIRDDSVFYWEEKVKSALSNWGFTECYTYSLVSKELGSGKGMLRLKNSLSEEWEYLRNSLTPSHLKVLSNNFGKAKELNLFEIANVYLPRKNDLPIEELHLIISSTSRDLYAIKGTLEALLSQMGLMLELAKDLSITVKGQQIGAITVHKELKVITAEINIRQVFPMATTTKRYTPISKFPPVIEDINVKLSTNQEYKDLEEEIYSLSELIKSVQVIDKYGEKLTLRVTYHSDSKQLSSGDVEPVRKQLINLFTERERG